MTTSSRATSGAGPVQEADPSDVLGAFSAAMRSSPDVTELARLANEFFAAVPGSPGAASTALATDPTRAASDLATLAPLPGAVTGVAAALPSLPGFMGRGLYFVEEAHALVRGTRGWSGESELLRPETVPDPLGAARRPFDVRAIRRDFPILAERVDGRPLVWLDNAATTQKPRSVIERVARFYEHENSNVHRAAHALAARATDAYEAAREAVRRFLNASAAREIVFLRGATEAINLVAQSWGRRHIGQGDEIVITWLEHHSNIVPWQLLCRETGARLRVAPVDDRRPGPARGVREAPRSAHTSGLDSRTCRTRSAPILPVREMVAMAHRHGARVLVDGAQAVSHMRVDVQALDCDFYVFSGHKVFGPTGIGVLLRARATSWTPCRRGRGAAT